MAQFTYYTASDAGAPTLDGNSGSLLGVLDACLVTGYGSQPGAGWTKPFVNSASIGVYQQGTGSMLYLYVSDNAITTSKESKITGYITMSNHLTGGMYPFPTAAQGISSQADLIVRKSAAVGATTRPWVVMADSRSFYMFVLTGDTANTYCAFSFGDFYSFYQGDRSNCLITGRIAENNASTTNDRLDSLQVLNTAIAGNFAPQNIGNTWTPSIPISKHGDGIKGSGTTLLGTVIYPNPADDRLYVSPIWIVATDATAGPIIRGTMRGFYQQLHPIASFTDGQMFSGSGDYGSKIFRIMKTAGGGGAYCMETSDTLDTN